MNTQPTFTTVYKPLTGLIFVILFYAVGGSAFAQVADTVQPIPAVLPHSTFLGKPTRLMLSCKKLLPSLAWWTRLGFAPLTVEGESADSIITISDGQIILTLTTVSMPSPIIVFAAPNMKLVKDTLDYMSIPYNSTLLGPTYGEYRVTSPNKVYMASRNAGSEPKLTVQQSENPVCGKFSELSSPATKLSEELAWWKDIGFSVVKHEKKPYHFAIVSDGTVTIGLHEFKEIPSTAITYYMPDMEQRIDRLKKLGITISEEIPTADGRIANAILTSPDGQLVYLFETP